MNQSSFLILLVLLSGCGLRDSIDTTTETNRSLAESKATLTCLNNLLKIPIEERRRQIGRECLKTLTCVEAWHDRWVDDCEARELGRQ